MALVVYKLGGSLLSLDDLAARLRCLLRARPDDRALIVVGGGLAADVVRGWSDTHALTEVAAHWLAVRSLSLNRGLVQHLLPESREVSSRDEAFHTSDSRLLLLLDVEACLLAAEREQRCPLPKCWDVTADSIAAWVAHDWAAEELVLLKSVGLPNELTVNEAAARGLIDPYFPLVAPNLPRISWCNLREAAPQVMTWCGSQRVG